MLTDNLKVLETIGGTLNEDWGHLRSSPLLTVKLPELLVIDCVNLSKISRPFRNVMIVLISENGEVVCDNF